MEVQCLKKRVLDPLESELQVARHGCWNNQSLREQYILSTTEPCLHSPTLFYIHEKAPDQHHLGVTMSSIKANG